MIEPMMRVENAGYVPFSSAVLWVMTNGGNDKKDLLDLGRVERGRYKAASIPFYW